MADLTIQLEEIERTAKYGLTREQAFARQLLAVMQRKQKLYDALHDLHALFSETDRTLDEVAVLGEVQELLYGPDPSEYPGV